ncbi:MAG: DnaD domain protein [Desulfosporosinus sp.]|nr:DnaD domain protein [Desulfosporosinus sp.]
MSRRRYISTDISIDTAELAQFGPLPLLLYTWAIPHLDDWGRMSGESRKFKLLVCPALDVTVSEVEKAIQQITDMGFWQRYQDNGKWFIAIPKDSWFKDQSYINTKKRFQDESKFPAPPSAENDRITPQKAVSPSPSPSPSLKEDDDNARAREEITNQSLESNHEESESPILEVWTTKIEDEAVLEADTKQVADAFDLPIALKSKLNEPKRPVHDLGSQAITFAELNFSRSLLPIERSNISDFCHRFKNRASPDPDAIVIEGIKRCVEYHHCDMVYLKRIIINWLDFGVVDLSHIAKADLERSRQKGHNQSSRKNLKNKVRGGNDNAKNLRNTGHRINDSAAYDPSEWVKAGFAVST